MITKTLAQNITSCSPDLITAQEMHEAKRSFLNWLGPTIGAQEHSSMHMAKQVAQELGSAPQATLLGTKEKYDLQFAALLNGMSSHIFDFDDTMLDTVLHPSAPIFPAILAWAEHQQLSPQSFLQSFIIGVEVAQRTALAICPAHYQRGWHVTGTVGSLGAAAAMGRLLELSAEKMTFALGLASTQPVGLREMFGTMTKPFHPGKAAANGLLAALLARQGFTSSPEALEAKRGYGFVLGENPNFSILTEDWGKEWQIMKNTYKPFACGIVTHPAIDGAIRLRSRGLAATEVAEILIEVHPLVLELTGKTEPQDQLQAKFSVYHCTAVALLEGRAGEWQFATEKVLDPEVVALRRKIKAVVNNNLAEDQAVLSVTLKNGEKIAQGVDHAVGSLANPLKDQDLETKFRDLTAPYLSLAKQNKIIDLVWQMDKLPSFEEIIAACQGE